MTTGLRRLDELIEGGLTTGFFFVTSVSSRWRSALSNDGRSI
jgi:hypothetical protein